MTVMIIAALSILAILLARHFAVTRILLGPRVVVKGASIEDGRKRINPSSAFLIASTLWIVFGIYLYVYRGLVHEKILSAIKVLQMPEALRELLMPLPLLFWGALVLGITVVLVGGLFMAERRGRVVTIGTKGLAIGDFPYTWNELTTLTVNEKQLCFFVNKQSHHYSWQLTSEEVARITANLPKPQGNSQL